MSSTYNIEAVQGSSLLLNINCSDSNGSYLNLNGYTARGYVRYSYGSTGVLLNLNPQIHPSYISGLITISGNANDMANLKPGIFVYDIEMSGSSNYVFKALKGYFLCEPEVTYG